jgi:hypothetical protein
MVALAIGVHFHVVFRGVGVDASASTTAWVIGSCNFGKSFLQGNEVFWSRPFSDRPYFDELEAMVTHPGTTNSVIQT